MKLYEYQAKQLFQRGGIPVPEGVHVTSVSELSDAIERLGGLPVVLKAQVLIGGRGKAGGVKVVKSQEEAQKELSRLLNSTLRTHQGEEVVKSVLVEKAAQIERELYWACLVDRDRARTLLLASSEGGVDIEELARSKPEAILKLPFDPANDLSQEEIGKIAEFLKIHDTNQLAAFANSTVRLFRTADLLLLEVNPLAVCEGGRLIALDSKVIVDDNARFRQEWLPPPHSSSPAEAEAQAAGLSWVDLGGNIACLVNGAGLAMATADAIHLAGGKPANFLDIGGAADEERIKKAFQILLRNPNIKSVLVNVFGGIVRCDFVAKALVETVKSVGETPPIVVRIEGTAIEEARQILKQVPNIQTAREFEEAAKLAVEIASGRNP